MNPHYRPLSNHSARFHAPAPAATRGPGKGHPGKNPAVLTSVAPLVGAQLAVRTAAQVLPTGGQVVSGQASVGQSGAQMTVDQASQVAILHWQDFAIGSGAKVQFNQPDASAVTLIRIVGGNASEISGQLSANGQVWLVNPNGVVFGKDSQVNMGGLAASTLDITSIDFDAGKPVFTRGAARGGITNGGNITVADGGTLALLAATVKNDGILSAQSGNVVLAGGNEVTLQAGVDGRLQVAVDPATVHTLIENRQLIKADGGQVVMTSSTADTLSASVVSNTGTVQARTLAVKEGRILLLGDMRHGEVVHSGLIDASAPDGSNGGFVETRAARVTLQAGRKVTTCAASGHAGTWLIKPGDYTIAPVGGDISGAQLSGDLDEGNVTIAMVSQGIAGGKGDIHFNDDVTWTANTLTLNAGRNIKVNGVMTAEGTAGLEMNYGGYSEANATAAAGSGVRMARINDKFTGRVDFRDVQDQSIPENQRLKINGDSYTILTALGSQDSTTGLDLQGIQGNLSGKYALGADIDASPTRKWSKEAGFAPIGDRNQAFGGIFDGLGHRIAGLTVKRPAQNHAGLFGNAVNATLRNVGLHRGSVEGASYVGGLVGDNRACGAMALVDNVYACARVAGQGKVGAIAGRNRAEKGGEIQLCNAHAIAQVSSNANVVGGLVGQHTATEGGTANMSRSYAEGAVSGADAVGGLVGLISSADGGTARISSSHAMATVDGKELVGGLVGGSISTGGKIEISVAYATGSVSGTNSVGGLMGATFAAPDSTVGISRSYATGSVSGAPSHWFYFLPRNYIGRLMGLKLALYGKVEISDSNATGRVSGASSTGERIGAEFAFGEQRIGRWFSLLVAAYYGKRMIPTLNVRD